MNPLEWFGMHCPVCGNEKTDFNWCRTCNAKRFQQNFKNWTSGNKGIDKFIKEAQLSAGEYYEVLEWIPYERFYDVEFLAKGGFGEVYKAKWTDGMIKKWDDKKRDWERLRANDFVALKCLSDSKNVSSEFIREVGIHKNHLLFLDIIFINIFPLYICRLRVIRTLTRDLLLSYMG
jgi:hypothetical protein